MKQELKKPIKIYFAGGWFNPQQLEQHTRIGDILEQRVDLDIHNPKKESLVVKGATQEQLQETFKSNLTSIDDADLVVALTDFNDKGTFIEIGYALAKNIPVLYVAENLNGKPFNLMLAVSGPVAFDTDSMLEQIYDIETYNTKLRFYEGDVE